MSEVINRPQMATATALPEALLENFTQRGLFASFQRMDEMTSYRHHMAGVEPFNVESLKKTDPDLYELCVQTLRPNDRGEITRADATLCLQPLERKEEQELRQKAKRDLMQSGKKAQEQIDDALSEELGQDFGGTIGEIPELPVFVDKQLRDLPGQKKE